MAKTTKVHFTMFPFHIGGINMKKNLNEKIKKDFMKEVINEIMLVDERANRLIKYIINRIGITKFLEDPRIESFIMTANEDDIDYDALVNIVMELKGYNAKPLDYIGYDNKQRADTYSKEEISRLFPEFKEFFYSLDIQEKPLICDDGFGIMIEDDYYKIYNVDKKRKFEPIYIVR